MLPLEFERLFIVFVLGLLLVIVVWSLGMAKDGNPSGWVLLILSVAGVAYILFKYKLLRF
jgi:hypothetical protein